MILSLEQREAIAKSIATATPFAAYRLPGSGEAVFGADLSIGRSESNLIENESEKAFDVLKITPWGDGRCAEIILKHRADDVLRANLASKIIAGEIEVKATSRRYYIKHVESLIRHLRRKGGKAVIARTITGITPSLSAQLPDIAEQLWERHPQAFGFIYFHPTTGLWVGATPEVLLKTDGPDHIATMALAGTRRTVGKETADAAVWDSKNRREQLIVKKVIVDQLCKAGVHDIEEQTTTAHYGSIAHICTYIKGNVQRALPYDEIVNRLNPTPAVGGYPRQRAMRLIAKIENFNRGCYAGHLQLTKANGEKLTFVNIRCAHVVGDQWCVYAGGGITARSSARDEWRETELKSQFLVGLLRNPELEQFLAEWHSSSKHIEAHTSGSTGKPKPIHLSKADMQRSAQATNAFFDIKEGDIVCVPLSMGYIAAKMMAVRAITAGAQLIVLPASNHFNVPLNRLHGRRIKLIAIVPSQIDQLVSQYTHVVDYAIVGGAAMTPQQEQTLANSPIESYATYGMTETASHVALRRVGDNRGIYRAMPGITFALTDDNRLIVEAHEYDYKRVVTNDVVKLLSPTEFVWVGRADNIINTGGVKIQIEEIERRLTPHLHHPFYIVGAPDPKWGQHPVLVVENPDNTPETIAQIAATAREVLPKMMRPAEVKIVEKLPRTATGKIKIS